MLFFAINVILLRILQVESICGSGDECRLLNDGYKIPSIAFSTWKSVLNLKDVAPTLRLAIESGYRHIDTAHLYGDETIVGQVLTDVFKQGKLSRKDIFITTKLDISAHTRDMVVAALKRSLNRLQQSYVDLYLIHSPYNTFDYCDYDIVDIWKGMQDCKELRMTRSIGVVHFNNSHINRLLQYTKIRPAVNMQNVNPLIAKTGQVAYCMQEGIAVMTYSPFGFTVPVPSLDIDEPLPLDNPILVKIAKKYGKDTRQIAIRYLIDREIIPSPRPRNKTEMSLYLDVFDFSLTQAEIYTINELDKNLVVNEKILNIMFRVQYGYLKYFVPEIIVPKLLEKSEHTCRS